jgi:DNA-binding NtrC family response regulator
MAEVAMAKILVLDDDKDYCEEIELALAREGYSVITAQSAPEAIKLGISERPDILVTDWMLRESLDGLSVAEILEVIQPAIQVILITGFASGDLKSDANNQEVFDLLEKPFSGDDIRHLVRKALSVSRMNTQALPIGVIEILDDNEIAYANPYVRKILFNRGVRATGKPIRDYLRIDKKFKLSEATSQWHSAQWYPNETGKRELSTLNIRARKIDERRTLLLVLTAENSSYMFEPIVYELLDCHPPKQNEISIKGHLLVIDDFPQIRRVAAAILKEFNCICHTARSQTEALDLFSKDERIKYVIIDLEMNPRSVGDFIAEIRQKRPQLKVIGSCSVCGDQFSEFDVDAFLPKPWSDEDLLKVLTASSQRSKQISDQQRSLERITNLRKLH